MNEIRPTLLAALGLAFFCGTLPAATWQPVPLFGGPILSLAAAPSAPGVVYAGIRPNGVVKSTDGGQTWISPGRQASLTSAYRLEVAPTDARLLFAEFGAFAGSFSKSADGGVTWEDVQVGSGILLGSASALTLDPRSPRTLWAATNHGIYRSRDLGNHWAPLALPEFQAEAVGVHPRKANLLFVIGRDALTEGKVLRSRDGGLTWAESSNFPGIVSQPHFGFNPAGDAFLLTSGTLYRSDDEGAAWIELNRDLSTYVRDFAFTRTGSLLIATSDGVLRSGDDGDTWLPAANAQGVRQGGPDGSVAALAPLSGGTILSGSDRGVWRSGSGGAGWRASSQGITAHHIGGVAASSNGVPRVLALTPEVFASADSGATWKKAASPGHKQVVFDPSDGDRAYGHGPSGLFTSRDGGLTWRLLLPLFAGYPPFLKSFQSAFAIDPSNSKKLYVAAIHEERFDPERTVLFALSTDGGRTWHQRQRPLDATALAVDPRRGNTLYATTFADLKKSLDAGTTWQSVGDLHHPSALVLDPNRADALWVGAPDGTVSWSIDGGRTFQPLGASLGGEIATLVPDPKRPDGVYAGVARKGIYRWDAGTAVWLPQGDGLTADRFLGDFALDGRREILWAGTDGEGLLRLEIE